MKPAIVAHEGRHDELARQLRMLAAQAAAGAGVELVDFRVAGSSSARRIRVDVDRAGPASVTHEDCRIVSSTLGAAIDEAGIITGNYTLEISSPGVDRLIRTPDDVRRNVGRRIIVQTSMAVDGREEFVGVLRGFVDEALCIDDDAAGAVRIPLDSVAVARQEVAF